MLLCMLTGGPDHLSGNGLRGELQTGDLTDHGYCELLCLLTSDLTDLGYCDELLCLLTSDLTDHGYCAELLCLPTSDLTEHGYCSEPLCLLTSGLTDHGYCGELHWLLHRLKGCLFVRGVCPLLWHVSEIILFSFVVLYHWQCYLSVSATHSLYRMLR